MKKIVSGYESVAAGLKRRDSASGLILLDPVAEGEVKLCEKQGPPSLPGFEMLGSAEIFQVLVNHPHNE